MYNSALTDSVFLRIEVAKHMLKEAQVLTSYPLIHLSKIAVYHVYDNPTLMICFHLHVNDVICICNLKSDWPKPIIKWECSFLQRTDQLNTALHNVTIFTQHA